MNDKKIKLKIPFSDEELLRIGQAMGKIGQTDIEDYAHNAIISFAKKVIKNAEKAKCTPELANIKK